MRPDAFFIPSETGAGSQRLYLHYPAQGNALHGLVLYIHPLAEELNKSRRMAALQARALAQAGYAVLQIDLLGCGDSAGDFGDATWQHWVSDVVQGCKWLRQHEAVSLVGRNPAPLWLWGLRAGCLLAVEASQQLDEACHFMLWQAPALGKTLLQQFLRLKVAGNMLSGNASSAMADMRRHLANGSPQEIAGYQLSPELASGLAQADLTPPACKSPTQRLEWLEVSSHEDGELSPASVTTLAQWRQAGFMIRSHVVYGSAFWQTSEIEVVPALIEASTSAVSALDPSPILEAA